MSIYTRLDSSIIKSCCDYKLKKMDSSKFANLCMIHANSMYSLEDAELEKTLRSVSEAYDCIFWYPYEENEKPEITDEIENKTRKELLSHVDKIEKLVIRGSTEGYPITKEERSEWWEKQRKIEREEFYKMNGYYEEESTTTSLKDGSLVVRL